MAKKQKKTKELKRRLRKIKERQRTGDIIAASQEKLLNRVKEMALEDGDKYYVDPDKNKEKLSEIIINFAIPLLDAAQTDEQRRTAIDMAIVLWNVSLMPEEQQKKSIKKFYNTARDVQPEQALSEEQEQLFSYFLARKKALFADVRRMILDYECLDIGRGLHLNVISTELAAAKN